MSSQVCYGANEVRVTRRFQSEDGSIQEESKIEGYTSKVTLVQPDCKSVTVYEDKKIHTNFGTAVSFAYYWVQSEAGQKKIRDNGGFPIVEKKPFVLNGKAYD